MRVRCACVCVRAELELTVIIILSGQLSSRITSPSSSIINECTSCGWSIAMARHIMCIRRDIWFCIWLGHRLAGYGGHRPSRAHTKLTSDGRPSVRPKRKIGFSFFSLIGCGRIRRRKIADEIIAQCSCSNCFSFHFFPLDLSIINTREKRNQRNKTSK